MKDRDISTIDFFKALQREYICLEIRSKIYLSIENRDYFHRLMEKKKNSILILSRRNNLPNIIDHDETYLEVWKEIVPKFGLPYFIYNLNSLSEKQNSFPYKGTVVKTKAGYGMSYHVNFKEGTIEVLLHGSSEKSTFNLNEVERGTYLQADEYFYYYPNNHFNTREDGIGTLQSYDMFSKNAMLAFENGESLVMSSTEISRII